LSTTRQEHFTEIVPYHELAHQWWGNTVSWHSYHDQWITEGIANYIALLFADTRKDSDRALRVWLGRYRDALTAQIPGRRDVPDTSVDSTGPLELGYRLHSSVNPSGYEQVVYAKSTWVFHMLRMMLRDSQAKDPDERFTKLLRSLVESHRGGALSTEDLEAAVQKVMLPHMDLEGGHSMSWFFDQWVRGTGIPHYKAEFTVQGSGDHLVVKGVLNQTGVSPDFLARVPLYASITGGKPVLLGIVTTAGDKTSFRFVTKNIPKRLLIDPELTLLCVAD
jgi:aminopeptidase N